MKKMTKKIIASDYEVISLFGGMKLSPMNKSAQEIKTYETETNNKEKTTEDIIFIVDLYIKEITFEYKIENVAELAQKIGQKELNSLKTYLIGASKEKSYSLQRAAVSLLQVATIKAVSAIITSHWWSKKIKILNKIVFTKLQKLVYAFSSAEGDKGLFCGILTERLSFAPEYGQVATLAGLGISIKSWADSKTWSTVTSKMDAIIKMKKYKLTVNVNSWNMEVRVY